MEYFNEAEAIEKMKGEQAVIIFTILDLNHNN